MIFNCPGSIKFKQPEPQSVNCQVCGAEAEIWTDETETVCSNCKSRVTLKKTQSCLGWCAYATICAGYKMIVNP